MDEMLLSGVAAAGGALLSGGRVALGVGATLPALPWAGEVLLSIAAAIDATLPSIVAVVDGSLLALDGVLDGAVLSLDGVVINEMMLLVADVAGGAVLLLLLLLEHCATVRTTAPQRNKVVAEPMTRWRTASR
ncbi:MAG TPA: hypothetical protein VIH06_15125 [Ilumatobacteraceae bacterium]